MHRYPLRGNRPGLVSRYVARIRSSFSLREPGGNTVAKLISLAGGIRALIPRVLAARPWTIVMRIPKRPRSLKVRSSCSRLDRDNRRRQTVITSARVSSHSSARTDSTKDSDRRAGERHHHRGSHHRPWTDRRPPTKIRP